MIRPVTIRDRKNLSLKNTKNSGTIKNDPSDNLKPAILIEVDELPATIKFSNFSQRLTWLAVLELDFPLICMGRVAPGGRMVRSLSSLTSLGLTTTSQIEK
jgi:hypothetical protein